MLNDQIGLSLQGRIGLIEANDTKSIGPLFETLILRNHIKIINALAIGCFKFGLFCGRRSVCHAGPNWQRVQQHAVENPDATGEGPGL